MKKLSLLYLLVFFIGLFLACQEDENEKIVDIEKVAYATTDYSVIIGNSAKSTNLKITPEDALCKCSIEKVTKDGSEFSNPQDGFSIDEKGIIMLPQETSLKEANYTITVKVINAKDESNFFTIDINFELVKLRDLEEIIYSETSFKLIYNSALTIDAPIINPQGTPLTYSLEIKKEENKITNNKISLTEEGIIKILENNALEAGSYKLIINAVNKINAEDKASTELDLNVYIPIESVSYSETNFEIEEKQALTISVPTITPANANVLYNFSEITCNGMSFTQGMPIIFNLNTNTGEIVMNENHSAQPGEYKLTVEAVSKNNNESKTNQIITVVVNKLPEPEPPTAEDFMYEAKPYYLNADAIVNTDAPSHKNQGNYVYTIEQIKIHDGMVYVTDTDKFTIDETTGIVSLAFPHDLTAKTYEVKVKATLEDKVYNTSVYFISADSEFSSLEYFENGGMHTENITAGAEYQYPIVTMIPNNISITSFSFVAAGCRINQGMTSEEIDLVAYGISIDDKGTISFAKDNAIPAEFGGASNPNLTLMVRITYADEKTLDRTLSFVINQ